MVSREMIRLLFVALVLCCIVQEMEGACEPARYEDCAPDVSKYVQAANERSPSLGDQREICSVFRRLIDCGRRYMTDCKEIGTRLKQIYDDAEQFYHQTLTCDGAHNLLSWPLFATTLVVSLHNLRNCVRF